MRKVYALLVVFSVLTGLVLIPGVSAAGSASYWIGTYGGTLLISPSPILSLPGGSSVFVSYVKEDMMVEYSVLREVAPNGSVEWAVEYGKGVIINALAETPDGKIVAAGTYFSGGSLLPDGFLMEIDKGGKVLWAKRYGGNGTDFLSVVTVLKNGEILAAGMTTSFGDAKGSVWLLKTDGHGNVLWERTYGTRWNDEPSSILVEPNGNVLIAGTSIHGSITYGLILSVDGNGNLRWAREYRNGMGLVIRSLSYSNGSLYASGYIYLGNGTIGALIMKLDGKGNVLWSRSYYRRGFFMLGGNMVMGPKGSWLSGALVRVLSNETTYYGILLHVSNGTLTDVRTYGPGMALRTLTIAPDGSLLLSGVTKNNTPLMARLPANGSLPNCKYLTSVKVEKTSPEVNVSQVELSTGQPKSTVRTIAVTTGKTAGNASLLCTYMPPEKGKGICGPGFIVLLVLLAVVPLRKR
ncbi:hypothetical protein [Thermococcus sp.]|uniref:hypothetical protein n=1 Tax=Thermococcus sp. TaxID=35749 RepID=UPI0026161EDF|nr:hypothetical protein [Thermococcus sp.]